MRKSYCRKLWLNRETLRLLKTADTSRVAGGETGTCTDATCTCHKTDACGTSGYVCGTGGPGCITYTIVGNGCNAG